MRSKIKIMILQILDQDIHLLRTKYAFMQSRRVFRYQPGRISGFTFGLRSSTEPVTGATMEWGISNPTDQYVFRIFQGNLSIVRRSTIPLEPSALERSGLSVTDQNRIQEMILSILIH